VEFVSDGISYVILRGRHCDIIVLNVHVQTEDKIDEIDIFYEELERVINKFPKYHPNILLGDLNTMVGKEDILKPTNGNGSLHEINNDNGVRVVNSDKFKNLTVKVQSSNIVTFVN
jgi:exonuclease III